MKSILKLNAFQIHLFFVNKFLSKITVCWERDCRMIPPFRFCICNEISTFPTLASGASIARGSPRIIGQKPEPTIRRGMTRKSLPPKRKAAKPRQDRRWRLAGDHEVVEGARVTCNLRGFYCHALSLSLLLRKIQLPPGGSLS